METRPQHIPLFLSLLLLSTAAIADPEDMAVSTWVDGCEHTMTTNHFELHPGQSVELQLDFRQCSQDRLGGLLYFGYKTTRNSSKPLTARDRVALTMIDNTTQHRSDSADGSLFSQLDSPTMCTLIAKNNGRKTIKIRLRANSGL